MGVVHTQYKKDKLVTRLYSTTRIIHFDYY
jgi:hypothetical protein